MRVISKATLVEFWIKHPASKHALQTWFEDASRAQWKTSQDIKLRYASASFVAANRVVFNIKGNDYRLVVAVAYRFAALYIKFVGTQSTTPSTLPPWRISREKVRPLPHSPHPYRCRLPCCIGSGGALF